MKHNSNDSVTNQQWWNKEF